MARAITPIRRSIWGFIGLDIFGYIWAHKIHVGRWYRASGLAGSRRWLLGEACLQRYDHTMLERGRMPCLFGACNGTGCVEAGKRLGT